MSLLLHLYPGDAWTLFVANVLVQVTVVVLAAWLLARLSGRWNAAWRYGIYRAALLCVLACPLVAFVMETNGIALVKFRTSRPADMPKDIASISVAPVQQFDNAATPSTPLRAAGHEEKKTEWVSESIAPERLPSYSWTDVFRTAGGIALLIWLLGMLWLVARWCYGQHLVAILRRSTRPVDAQVTESLRRQVRQALGVNRLPPMATSADLDRPIMIGLFRPLVILPKNLLQTVQEAELVDILVHECAHAICRHQLSGLFQRLAVILFWPHPLIHLLNRALARAREEVCDNYVLRHREAPRYARTLLELSQLLVGASPKTTALGLFPCPWRLEDRVADLLDRRRKVMIRVNRWTTAAITAAFLMLAILIAGTRVVATASAVESQAAERTVDSSMVPAASEKTPPDVTGVKAEPRLPVAGRNFVMVPFTTELQRAESWKYGKAKVFILINGKALFKEDNKVLDAAALDYEGLWKALESISPYGQREGCFVRVVCPPFPKETMYISASSVFLCFLHTHGWHSDTDEGNNVEMTHYRTDLDWPAVVADLSKPVTEEDIRFESGVGDDLVKVYPIRTPLSRFFYGRDGENCVIRNMKPLDQFTSADIQSFREQAKTCVAKLGLKQTPGVRFLTHYGDSISKSIRVDRELLPGNDAWWKAQGFKFRGRTMWEGGQPSRLPVLLLKVVDENGAPVQNVKIGVEYPEENKAFFQAYKPEYITKQNDGRWRCINLPSNDDFTLTVESPGYEAASQKLNLSRGETKELEIKLKKN